jgi:chromosome segregation protein
MFKLQRLEITGFKSFADYTEIIFTGDGITAVVGPNGCGKSNVSDAIAWVLGEQRAKSLRGEEMKDVIFQGTSKRPASGMAEVVLHLVRDEETYSDLDLEEIDETLSEFDEKAVRLEDFDPEAAAAKEEAAQEAARTKAAAQESEAPVASAENVESPEFIESIEPIESIDAVAETNGNGFQSDEQSAPALTAATATVGGSAAATALAVVPAENIEAAVTAPAKIHTKRHWRPRRLALDFAPGEAVSVTRRLYMSGESEYLLNNKTCRLRDIQDLFSGTGLSGAHYALIEQGRIGQILSAKPSERRALLEEAAGISKFRTRQRAAELRLEGAKTNLRRITDIVVEIEKQEGSLRRQAAKTRRFVNLQDEFRGLQRQVFSAESIFLTGQLEELKSQLTAAVEKERTLEEELLTLETSVQNSTADSRKAEEDLAFLKAKQADAALQLDRAVREIAYQEEQLNELTTRAELLKQEIAETEKRLSETAAAIQQLQDQDLNQQAETEKEQFTLQEAEGRYQQKLADLRALESEQETLRADILLHTTATERYSEVARQLEITIEKLKERQSGLAAESERAGQAFQEAEELAAKAAADKGEQERALSELRENSSAAESQAAAARAALKEQEEKLFALNNDLSRAQHRLESLQELEASHAIYTPAVQKLFAAQDHIGVRFAGTLADKLKVEARAERAVESLFGPYLQTIIVENGRDAANTAAWLRKNHIGRIALLDTSTNVELSFERHSGIAQFLGVSPQFAALLARVFPREMSARIIENSSEASGDLCVTWDGEVIAGGRLIVTGRASEKNTGLLSFKRELRELEDTLKMLSGESERAVALTENLSEQTRQKETAAEDLRARIAQAEREFLTLEMKADSARQDLDRAERHRAVVADETALLDTELNEAVARLEKTGSDSSTAALALSAATAAIESIIARLTGARETVERENLNFSEQRAISAAASERRRAVASELRRSESEHEELDLRLARQKQELRETSDRAETLGVSMGDLKARVAAGDSDKESEAAQIAAAAEQLKFARAKADEVSEKLKETNHAATAAVNARAEIEVHRAESATRLEALSETCRQDLGLSLAELTGETVLEEDFELDANRERLDEMRARLDSFGAVNLLALEELAEVEERLLFLTGQRKDIIDSIDAAEEALREIKSRSRERFRETFEAVNAYFKEFFQELFGGGHGEMSLLETGDGDILEAGVELIAQPPGKKLQNVLLLSGGEKAMTAIALVLAIFKHHPSPFCLLDEVDAPLDEANVGRFVRKIEEMATKTQFIVITHNKGTMEAARALYGVTMAEAGVSQVVSVKFA